MSNIGSSGLYRSRGGRAKHSDKKHGFPTEIVARMLLAYKYTQPTLMDNISTVNSQLWDDRERGRSHYQLPTVNCQLSTLFQLKTQNSKLKTQNSQTTLLQLKTQNSKLKTPKQLS
ncbi:MAG: hypothetical protein MUE44_15810 [Oscillatoriaceae cyanobacterium Prado104]|nr:hypothetical protein [Oscillatoriaceae cyanobacterium Prado104]